MLTYTPPLKDMLFVLKDVLAAPALLAQLPAHADVDEALMREVLEQAGRFARDVIFPLNASGDAQGCTFDQGRVTTPDGFADAYRQFLDGGWPALACATEDGGQGLPHTLNCALFEMLALHDQRPFDELMKISALNTSLVLLLPYTILWLYFSWTDKKKRLEEIDHEDHQPAPAKKGMLSFHDEKGELKLSVQSDQLLYLESADNYVKIHFLSKGKITHFMLRNSLKNLDESLANTPMIRCHRSYTVNFDKVKVMRKEKDGIYLAMDEENIPDIPVSKTYTERVMAKFALYSV
jgi:hypothetical protein